MRKTIASIMLLFISVTAHAATPQSLVGGSGIGFMRTAQVMFEGESSWSLNMGYDLFNSTTTPGQTASLSTMELGYATYIGGSTELGLNIPYAIYSPDSTSTAAYGGTQDVRGYFKHSFTYPGKQDGFGAAISVYASIAPGNAAANVSSGKPQYGTELNLSHWARTSAIHLNIGTENRDIWNESVTPVFSPERLLNVDLGIEFDMSKAVGMTVEALMSQAQNTSQQNIFLGLVFQYAPSKHWAFTFGGGAGMPAGTNFPTPRMVFGLTYSPTGQYQSRYSEAASYVDYVKLTKKLQSTVDSLNSRVDALEQRLHESKVPKDNQNSPDDLKQVNKAKAEAKKASDPKATSK